ncbi:MAG TPA: GtrA family protein [Rubrivivax sp.]|nr:GtrA family protein [Rubrivivax sp.]
MNRSVRADVSVNIQRPMPKAETVLQLLRFGIGGVVVNLSLYVVYLILIYIDVEYRFAMSVVYCVGMVFGFVLHRSWTFRNQGTWHRSFRRYVLVYAIGYLLNLAGLWLLVDITHQSAALAQGFMILVVAGFVFLIQKFWVFRKIPEQPEKFPAGSGERIS